MTSAPGPLPSHCCVFKSHVLAVRPCLGMGKGGPAGRPRLLLLCPYSFWGLIRDNWLLQGSQERPLWKQVRQVFRSVPLAFIVGTRVDEALWARSDWGWRPGAVLCTHTQAPWHPGILPKVRSSAGMKAVPGRLGQWAGGRVYHCAHQLSHDARPHESSLETHPIHLDPLA